MNSNPTGASRSITRDFESKAPNSYDIDYILGIGVGAKSGEQGGDGHLVAYWIPQCASMTAVNPLPVAFFESSWAGGDSQSGAQGSQGTDEFCGAREDFIDKMYLRNDDGSIISSGKSEIKISSCNGSLTLGYNIGGSLSTPFSQNSTGVFSGNEVNVINLINNGAGEFKDSQEIYFSKFKVLQLIGIAEDDCTLEVELKVTDDINGNFSVNSDNISNLIDNDSQSLGQMIFGDYTGQYQEDGDLGVCGLKLDRSIWCWGESGINGSGSVTSTPVEKLDIQFLPSGIFGLEEHIFALSSKCEIASWGTTSDIGSQSLSGGRTASPDGDAALVSDGVLGWDTSTRKVEKLVGDHQAACAILDNQEFWTWGRNNYGELGIGTIVSEINPVQVQDPVVSGAV